MKKKALFITSSQVQDQEFIYPYFRLLEEGFEIDVFILEQNFVKGILGTTIPPIKNQKLIKIEDININNYNFLVLPGGVKSMEKLRQEKRVINLINDFNKKNIAIASICSAAQLLISAKIVKNRKISGYYSMKDDIINAGGIYTDLPAVIDDNIITTAHYKDLGPWMAAALKIFYEKNK
jgi:protease I